MLETVKKAFNKLGLLLFFYLALTTVTGSFLECSLRRPYRQKGQFSMLGYNSHGSQNHCTPLTLSGGFVEPS